MLYPYFHPEPLPDYITPALGNLASSLRQGEEQKRQQSQQEEDQRNQAIYAQYMRLAPDQQQKVYPMLPDSLRSMAFNPAAVPAHTPTDLEQSQNAEALAKSRFGAKVATDSFNTFDTLPQSARQEGTYQSGYGAAMPSESVKLANAQDVTRNKSSWTPEVQQRQAIEDKRALDAKDTATVPSENAVRDAERAKLTAERGKLTAETGKLGVETNILRGDQTFGSFSGGVPKSGGPPTFNGIDLTNVDPLVRGLVKRDIDPMMLRNMARSAEGQARLRNLLGAAQQIDPNFNMQDYPTQVATKRNFASGKGEALAVRNINQFVAHVNELADAEKAMDNTTFAPGVVNRYTNAVGGTFSPASQEKQGRYGTIADAVANEYENMLRGSSLSTGTERKDALTKLNMNRSPADIKGAIDGMLRVMDGRLGELQDQYRKGTGLQENFDILNPRSKSILQRFGRGEGVSDAVGTGMNVAPVSTQTLATSGKPQNDPLGLFGGGR